MFKRKIYDKLLKWKNEALGSKAMLIEGARRIGKSTIVEEFAKENYKSYILIDFSKVTNSVKETFNNLLNSLDSLFMILSLEFDTPLYPRESLIIFDEVQKFPRAREAIKHLVKDGRYDYIETGSLISIKDNIKDILIPSEEQSIKMFPMDFEEFSWALGEEMLINYIRDCFEKKVPLHDSIHKKAMFLFKQYMLVGGMPKAVDEFVSHNKQFLECEIEKRDILKTYRDDIHKIDRAYRSKVLSIFDQIPSFLSQHEKRVKINSISTNSTAIDYEETFFWLSDSMICNECFLCTDPNIGLSLNEKRNFVKCYMCDTGLLLTHTFDESNKEQMKYHKELLSDKLSINKGMFYENIIAQMLVSNGHKLYFYTRYNDEKHRNDIEIDFLLTTGNKVSQKLIPIEVKSSKSYKVESMKKFIEVFKNRIDATYIIHPKNLSIREDGIICIPAYMTFCL
ncbi:MAG: AAA family ATPase [Bacilli bacterium]|nr:AAA family ATPase [Bacilli bacterium]